MWIQCVTLKKNLLPHVTFCEKTLSFNKIQPPPMWNLLTNLLVNFFIHSFWVRNNLMTEFAALNHVKVITGPLAHQFYTNIDRLAGATKETNSNLGIIVKKILIERFLWAPSFLLVTLYMLEIFQVCWFSFTHRFYKHQYFECIFYE